MGWIRGAPSKRRINGRLSVTRTAFPTSNAATVAVKKPLKSMPCSSRIKRLVHRIRLKPMKKKIVGGSACRICTSHQSRARRGNDTGAETETLGWLTPYLPKHCAESRARLCGLIQQRPPHQRSSNRRGVQARLSPRVRGDRIEAARLALPQRSLARLAQVQESDGTGGEARGRGGVGKGEVAVKG